MFEYHIITFILFLLINLALVIMGIYTLVGYVIFRLKRKVDPKNPWAGTQKAIRKLNWRVSRPPRHPKDKRYLSWGLHRRSGLLERLFLTTAVLDFIHIILIERAELNTRLPGSSMSEQENADIMLMILFQGLFLLLIPFVVSSVLAKALQNRISLRSRLTEQLHAISYRAKQYNKNVRRHDAPPPANEQKFLLQDINNFIKLARRCGVPESDPRVKNLSALMSDSQRPYLTSDKWTNLQNDANTLTTNIYDGQFIGNQVKNQLFDVLLSEKYRPLVAGFFTIFGATVSVMAALSKTQN